MPKININLRERSYGITVGNNLLRNIGYDIANLNFGRKCVIITDDKVGPLYANQVCLGLKDAGYIVGEITLQQGESNKCLASVENCYHQMLSFGLDRRSFVVALGGGIIGDMAGYVAATYMRGIRFIQVPTTLLADVDASIGGKTGVNLREGKNLVGAFHQPQAVFIDVDTLKTLNHRDILSGFAEMLKHSLICDKNVYSFIKENADRILKLDAHVMENAIVESCKIKAGIVEKDEREESVRALLNFGHTIGHAIESLSIEKEKPYRHGEAVSIGMIIALDLSEKMGYIQKMEAVEIVEFISSCGLPITCTGIKAEEIMQRMRADKKIIEGKLRFILLKAIGEAFISDEVEYDAIVEVLKARCFDA